MFLIEFSVSLPLAAKLFNEKRDALLFRLGLRLKKENDETGETISHQSKLPYTTILTTIPESTPLWIYIVSIICGLLFFTLLTYGLYRCGFFRREKREEIARLTRQVRERRVRGSGDYIYWIICCISPSGAYFDNNWKVSLDCLQTE